MDKVALITGITGQDGSYLAEELLDAGYSVHGIVRRNSIPEHQQSRIGHLSPNVSTYYGDVLDVGSVRRIVESAQPTHVFNLAAQSHVRISFDIPQFTLEVNLIGLFNVLEAVRELVPASRVYQASSSEMFGTSIDEDGYQRETTPMHPASPYGIAKLAAFHLARTFRDGYGLFVANGILFNHESPRRGSNFVSRKIIKAAVRIAHGSQSTLSLGNLESLRDWGHSRDYVKAMQIMLEASEPDDYVVATGQVHTVRDLCERAFRHFNLDYQDFISIDPRLYRPKEVPELRGDSSKIRRELGWEPDYDFDKLVNEMVVHEETRFLNEGDYHD